MRDPYSVLGVSRNATDEQVKTAYKNLVKKYHPDNYDDNNPLKDLANEKMQEVNAAYDEILRQRAAGENSSSSAGSGSDSGYDYYYQNTSTGVYREIREDINARRFADAEKKLYSVLPESQTAEWHYLCSVLLMRRNRVNDAMRELECACSMDPSNVEYQKAKEMFNQRTNGYGSTYYDERSARRANAANDACDCCTNLICLDCLCECMGGDLIRCI